MVDSDKATDTTELVAMKEVTAVEEDTVATHITPTTPRTGLTFDIFLRISAVPIGMLVRETVGHMLAVNSAVQILVEDALMKVHVGDMSVAKDNKYQKLTLIGLTPAKEDVAAEDEDHRMALALEEKRIES